MRTANLIGLGNVLSSIPKDIQDKEDRDRKWKQDQQAMAIRQAEADAQIKSEALNQAIAQHTIGGFGQSDARQSIDAAQKLDPYGYMNAPGMQELLSRANVPNTGQTPLNMQLAQQTAQTTLGKDKALLGFMQDFGIGGQQPQAQQPQNQLPIITGPQAPPVSGPQVATPSTSPLPPAPQRQIGQTYQTPSGPAVWQVGPSGQPGLVAQRPQPTPGAQPNTPGGPVVKTGAGGPLPTPTAPQAGIMTPDVMQRMKMALVLKTGLGIDPSTIMPPPGSSPQEVFNTHRAGVLGDQSAKDAVTPAMAQRGMAALTEAGKATHEATTEMERLFPGIQQAYAQNEIASQSQPWSQFFRSNQPGHFNDALGNVRAMNERLKYSGIAGFGGQATPFGKLVQNASFANIEQMAGQLPGVRGLGQIAGLFKEHQSRFGHEAPLESYMRLKHMEQLMGDATSSMVESSQPQQLPPQVVGQ